MVEYLKDGHDPHREGGARVLPRAAVVALGALAAGGLVAVLVWRGTAWGLRAAELVATLALIGWLLYRYHAVSVGLAQAADLADAAPDAILVVDAAGTILLANARVTGLLGYEVPELLGQNVDVMVPEAQRAGHRAKRTHYRRTREARPMGSGAALSARCKDGSLIPVDISLSMSTFHKKPVTICVIRDMTEARRVREALTHANEELRRGVAALEGQTRALRKLEQASEFLQCCATESEAHRLAGHWAVELAPGTNGALFLYAGSREAAAPVSHWSARAGQDHVPAEPVSKQTCWALRRGRAHYSEAARPASACAHVAGSDPRLTLCIPLMAQGETLGVLVTQGTDETLGDAQEYILHALADRTAIAIANLRLRDALKAQTLIDPLTGLHNRRFFAEVLDGELGRVRRKEGTAALLLVDVDHFKRLNDTWGHPAGDAFLRAMGRTLSAAVANGGVVGRLGGEEFAVLLRDVDERAARRFAESLCTSVRALRVTSGQTAIPPQSISVGIALAPLQADDSEGLMRIADECLYRAKSQGRDRVVVSAGEATQRLVWTDPSQAVQRAIS